MKKCSKCKEVKPFEEFSRDRNKKDGCQTFCKLCLKKYLQSEKGKVSLKKYFQSEKGKASNKASHKKYDQSEKGKLANKRKLHKRRAAMKDTFSTEEWNDRLKEYNYACAYCYKPFPKDELTVDHMQPISRGGKNTIDNLVPACKSCNSRKQNKTPLEMLQKGFM